ncbi:MAG: hypothetical protein LBI36_05470 [Oscillospiraceae bacterium]|jgi:hypothetical protein|nr:hypothetical protein [Oscillospiraceae bacterium]
MKNPADFPENSLISLIIALSVAFACAVLTALIAFLPQTRANAAYQSDLSRHNTLTTTGDPTRRSIFTADGNKITARGFYGNDRVSAFEIITNLKSSSLEFKPFPDGTYTAVFEGAPIVSQTYAYIRLVMESGDVYNYRVEYNQGWFFGDNGLPEKNEDIVENHTDMGAFISSLYLVNEDGAARDAEETLFRVKTLTDEVTAGLDGEYDKARAITGWVADNIYYDNDARENDVSLDTIAINRVLDVRRTTCAGYANLTAAMLESAGIKAVTVIGSALSLSEYDVLLTISRHHEWTAFWYGEENRWVMLDSGWDSGNNYKNGRYTQKSSPRKYFDISPLAFSQNHRAEKAEYREYFSVPLYFASIEGTTETSNRTASASEPPASEPPVSEPPVSESPVSEPPASEPPASEPPVSEPPASEPPVSEPPASEPLVSEPPVSEPPVSEYNNPNAPNGDLPLYIALAALSAGVIITGTVLLVKVRNRS